MSEVIILFNGYSKDINENRMSANCTCTLIKGDKDNIIVDTMTAWDSKRILTALNEVMMKPENINYVISTHGHSDHIGNNNLFLQAKHIVGFCISYHDTYYLHPFDKGAEYHINESVKVIPTPGHTMSDVTVLVKSKEGKTFAITGDLFEKHEDIDNSDIWMEAGSENPVLQLQNRSKVADLADYIIPGHGPMFEVTEGIRDTLRKQIGSVSLEHNFS